MSRASEKQLDAALDAELKSNPGFADWFVSRTKFAGLGATYLWSRSNHPWGSVAHATVDEATGQTVTSIKESETDVLVVFETPDGMRFALHIENKTAAGSFEPLQPELYAPRARQWMGNPKYRSYTDYETVLVAPKVFYARNEAACGFFDRYVSHEEIGLFIPLFA
ncbi:hypothetical protein ISN76_19590 [Dyella halodurans]|uniref:Uncharacterized protein n=1 Tax=Dyella halodurans TaxID=1920171 RepID=A0ABV9C171_9GAMM|nr:hypothetical protein [Dyella halodurans]